MLFNQKMYNVFIIGRTYGLTQMKIVWLGRLSHLQPGRSAWVSSAVAKVSRFKRWTLLTEQCSVQRQCKENDQ